MQQYIKTFEEFQNELVSNVDLQNQFKEDPKKAVQQFVDKNPLATDKWIYRIVVISLGSTVVLIVLGLLFILSNKILIDKDIITVFTALGSGALGALAGLLTPVANR